MKASSSLSRFLTATLLVSHSSMAAPPNDNCSGPTEVHPVTFNMLTPQIGTATAEPNEPLESCEFLNAGTSNSVWFSITPAFCGILNLDTKFSNYDTVLSVFEGVCETAIEIACDDDSGARLLSALADVSVSAERTYLIKVAHFGFGPLPESASLRLNGQLFPIGDLDTDCDVDLDDYHLFAMECLAGPDASATRAEQQQCHSVDFDDDGDIDLFDFSGFQNRFEAP